IAAQQDEVIELLVRKAHLAHHMIANDGFAFIRRAETNDGLYTGRRFGRVAVAPAPVIAGGAAFGAGFLAHFFKLFRACVAAICLPLDRKSTRLNSSHVKISY